MLTQTFIRLTGHVIHLAGEISLGLAPADGGGGWRLHSLVHRSPSWWVPAVKGGGRAYVVRCSFYALPVWTLFPLMDSPRHSVAEFQMTFAGGRQRRGGGPGALP